MKQINLNNEFIRLGFKPNGTDVWVKQLEQLVLNSTYSIYSKIVCHYKDNDWTPKNSITIQVDQIHGTGKKTHTNTFIKFIGTIKEESNLEYILNLI